MPSYDRDVVRPGNIPAAQHPFASWDTPQSGSDCPEPKAKKASKKVEKKVVKPVVVKPKAKAKPKVKSAKAKSQGTAIPAGGRVIHMHFTFGKM